MGDTLIERIIILTSPVGLALLFFGWVIHVWENHIWCTKRWYFNYYDYYLTKRRLSKGVTNEELKYFKRWINSNPKHPMIERFKSLVNNYQPIKK